MRRKLLGKEHEFWLKENYSRYENPVLATKLTEMVQKSHEKEYEELVRMLPSLSDPKLIESVSERILFLSKPVTISVANVKAAARRLNCPRKKLGLISTLRSRSAKSRHIRRWAYKAIEVDKPFQGSELSNSANPMLSNSPVSGKCRIFSNTSQYGIRMRA